MDRLGGLLAAFALAAGSCSGGDETAGAEDDPRAPDGVPVPLPEGASLVAWHAMDIDGDKDRDLLAAVVGPGPGLRVFRYVRRGRRYAKGEQLESAFLEELPEGAILDDGVRLAPVEPDFFRVEVRYVEDCAEDEREEVAAEVFFSRRRGSTEIFRANASYRRTSCPLATSEHLARCGRPEEVAIDVRTQLHEGAREIEVNVEGVTFSIRPEDGKLVGDAESATRGLREVLEEAERFGPRNDVAAALARLSEVERLVGLVCAGRGDQACHGTPIGIPEEARPACEVDGLLLQVRRERAEILGRAGRAREALRVLGPPIDPSGGARAATLRTARAEVLRIVAPANAAAIGQIPRARPPRPPDLHLRGPFAWVDDDHVVYPAGGSGRRAVFGLWKAEVGDQGMLPPEKRYLAARVRHEITSSDQTRVVVAADRFGLFVCRTGDDERSCRVFAKDSLGRESGARCSLVDEALVGHGGGRIVVDPCAGPTDPVPLGFVDESRLALVAARSAEPIVARVAAPAERRPLPRGPSPIFEGTDFLPDGSARLVWTPEGTFLVPRGGGPERRVLPPGEELRHITVSPNGRRFVALEGERGARVWELP